ncbi:MAG: ribonucleotide-diphosphate reductase subunit beta, partial [Snodgrassella alvi]|nr:ribonucleotide-diphosphate reductase subunit beta [Snodgrassella alvi]
MNYSTFCQKPNNALTEPMFFGQPVNVARYDQQKFDIFEKLIEKQLSFFWRPEEVDVSRDRIDYANLPEHEKHIFISNLKYQTLLDSIQGRSPNVALLPLVSIPELETWIETWSFSETIHSRSYTHIIRNIVNDPSIVFDDIVQNKHIIARAEEIACYYDDLIEYTQYYNLLGIGEHQINGKTVVIDLHELKKKLYLCLMCVNVLEAIRFYVSFACSFAFAERELMEGNAKIIKLIARDEALHLTGTQQMLNLMRTGADDPEMAQIAAETEEECFQLFRRAAIQEKDWAEYLFKDGSMIGLNKDILGQYVE